MGLTDFIKKQFSDVIEWKHQEPDVLFYKFPNSNDVVQTASQLIIAAGQGCLLLYEGRVNDVLEEEGIYILQTDNHPFITALQKLRQGGESEHRLRLYFFRRADITNQGWGTTSLVKYEDPVYHFPVSLGVYGNYSMRLTDARAFLTEIAGLSDMYTTQQAKMLIQSRIGQQLTVVLASAAYSFLQIDGRLNELAETLHDRLNQSFRDLGFTLIYFAVQGSAFDAQTTAQINTIADAKAGSLAAEQAQLSYTEMARLEALRAAAQNSSGMAGAGLQLNAGSSLGSVWNQQPDKTTEKPDAVAQLQKLKALLDEGILTQEEFNSKKKQWLEKL